MFYGPDYKSDWINTFNFPRVRIETKLSRPMTAMKSWLDRVKPRMLEISGSSLFYKVSS